MAEKVTKIRNDLSIVKTSRGYKWRMHDHTGAAIAASSQYYASHYAARRAAERATVRMHKWGVENKLIWATPPNTVARVGEAMQTMHGSASSAIEPQREEAKPRKRFSLFGR